MLRNDLLDNGYHFEIIEPKKTTINLLWAGFAVLLTAPVLWLYFMIINGDFQDISLPYIEFSATALNILFIGAPVLYFILKAVFTALFSSNINQNIETKTASDTGIPVLVGRDAFKTRQILIIYLTPLLFTYPLLILAGIISGGDINVLVLILIMTYFMSSDLLLVMYVLFLKTRYNAEYIAIKNHVYMLTLYSGTYIKRKNHSDMIKRKLYELKKSIKNSIPQIKLKVILLPLILAGLLFVSVNYIFTNKEKFIEVSPDDFETYLEYCDNMQPVIKKYTGDIFANTDNNTEDYTGCEILAGRNIIYCNDNGSVIYFDSEKDSVMRLNNKDKTERLCIYEDCRNNPDERCGHMPDFVSNGCYSDGVLYGAQTYSYVDEKYGELLKCYIIRYDIYKSKMDKLIDFEMGDENAYIHNMFICYNYLYAVVSADNMSDLTVARIDLSNEEACLVYADKKNPRDRDKIENLMYNKNNIFSSLPSPNSRLDFTPYMVPASGVIYQYDLNMNNFGTAINLGYYTAVDEHGFVTGYTTIIARQVDIYEQYIYYTVNIGNQLCRYNMKMKKKDEGLLNGVVNYYIDGNWLYYTTYENTIYKVKIDGNYTDSENNVTYIDSMNSIAVYTPESGYSLGEWNVKDDYMYLVLYSGGDKTLRRIKTNSSSDPYIFW